MTGKALLPPATIAILGGGQLGAMICEAARHMGYKTIVVSEKGTDPAGHWADRHEIADPRDATVVERIARECDVMTVEFEGIMPEVLQVAEQAGCRVSPVSRVQATVRDRRLEKTFLKDGGFPVGASGIVESADQIVGAYEMLSEKGARPVIAKTARGGYDGKGQQWLRSVEEARAAWEALGAVPLVLEQAVGFVAEASVIVARASAESAASFPMFRNEHRNGILFQTVIPAGFSEQTEKAARKIAEDISQKLGVVGLIAVEMFVLADGSVLVNELAARPHNSGHVTLRAATRSQFELHVLAICGLPLPHVEMIRPAVMTNLLGNLWSAGEPPLQVIHADGRATLHVYGKNPRPGRKMGHMIHTAGSAAEALAAANATFAQLSGTGT